MEYEHYTDEELIEHTLENKEVFRYIITRYEGKLRRYVRRITSVPEQDIDDILQEVFIKAYKNLRDFDSEVGTFSAWIYRIAYNNTVSVFRRRSARPEYLCLDDNESLLETLRADDDVLQEVEAREFAERLARAIARLPSAYRDVIILSYFEEKSYKDISDILKIPMGTVATKLNRAKQKLKQLLESNTKL